MSEIRLNIILTEKEEKAIDNASKKYHRNRKNLYESILRLSINQIAEYGAGFIDLRDLGEINNNKH